MIRGRSGTTDRRVEDGEKGLATGEEMILIDEMLVVEDGEAAINEIIEREGFRETYATIM